jgi:hypothetical protein
MHVVCIASQSLVLELDWVHPSSANGHHSRLAQRGRGGHAREHRPVAAAVTAACQ